MSKSFKFIRSGHGTISCLPSHNRPVYHRTVHASTTSKPFRLLISGIGVTGPVVAFWLARASRGAKPIHITMIERASSLLTSGQGIDVQGEAKEIAARMGLLQTIKSRTTGERGFQGIDNDNRSYATFDGGGLTQEIEVMRGDLCDVLTNAIKEDPNVELQYDRSITSIRQSCNTVRVTISQNDGHSYEEEYDAVVASDGIRSKTRDMMLDPKDAKDCVKPISAYTAFFSIPTQPQDALYSRWQHGLQGRSVVIRPVTKDFSSVYLFALGAHPALAKTIRDRDQYVKRQAWAETFGDVTYGEYPRVVREMLGTDNFYSDQISQVKLSTWSKGRCALVGDAAYATSPVTGMGTQTAFLGAYVLAGELAKNLDDPASAFRAYEGRVRAHIEKAQRLPLGGMALAIFNPQSKWGVWALQTTLRLISWTRVWKLAPESTDKLFPLPDYNFGRQSE